MLLMCKSTISMAMSSIAILTNQRVDIDQNTTIFLGFVRTWAFPRFGNPTIIHKIGHSNRNTYIGTPWKLYNGGGLPPFSESQEGTRKRRTKII